eukprot:TRINITY_DN4794_c0_g1_i1.p1 TRINITY_DN4794_c0_g1~~TRINITY_DN4794_c0_g1_i1.p1  ORF type:complete len:378 (-),score=92.41 TRINITY_DN4794_c0_g1_i1:33-1166(-)
MTSLLMRNMRRTIISTRSLTHFGSRSHHFMTRPITVRKTVFQKPPLANSSILKRSCMEEPAFLRGINWMNDVQWWDFSLGVAVGSFLSGSLALAGFYYFCKVLGITWYDEQIKEAAEKKEKEQGAQIRSLAHLFDPAHEHLNMFEAFQEDERFKGLPIDIPFQIGGSLLICALSFMFIKKKASVQWEKRTFLTRVGFTVHTFHNNRLAIRTVFERDLSQILLKNTAAMDMVTDAAKATTIEHPFLALPSKDGWLVVNQLLNEISSSLNPIGFFLEGAEAIHKWYVFGLTCEKGKELFQRKLRVILISEKDLRAIVEKSLAYPVLDNEVTRLRWRTLQKMAELYSKESMMVGKSAPQKMDLGRVEVIIPKGFMGPPPI